MIYTVIDSVERRASAGEAVVGDYQQLGDSYAMNNLISLHRNSLNNTRIRSPIPNTLAIEEEGEKLVFIPVLYIMCITHNVK